MTGEPTVDRRTLLQASGTVGAGTLGLGAVTADPDADHYVVLSDTHLGSPFANIESFETFLAEELPELDPDVLVLAGDIYEWWFRGMSSVLLEYSDTSAELAALDDEMDVVLVAGNHDRRLVTVGEAAPEEITPSSPWTVGEEFYFESGDTEFVAVHGDGPDLLQQDPVSDTLCAGSDTLGALLLAFMDYIDELQPWAQVGEVDAVRPGTRRTVETGRTYEDPIVVTDGTADGRVHDTGTGFEVVAGDGRVGYAVVERGRHTLGTTAVEAGRASPRDWETVTFAEPFDRPPVLLTDTQPTADPAGDIRVRNVTRAGFETRLDGSGSVGYLAVEPGDLTVRGRRGVAGRASVDGRGTVGFGRSFRDRPVTLVSTRTPEEGSVAVSRAGTDGLTVAGAGSVGYLALGPGGLHASESSSVRVPTVESRVQSRWEHLTEQADTGDLLPDQPPGVAGVEPLATGHEFVKSQLLDSYERFVLFGHTHVPDRGDRYANAGPWTTRGPSVTENNYIEILDGEVTVWDWSGPGEREPLFD